MPTNQISIHEHNRTFIVRTVVFHPQRIGPTFGRVSFNSVRISLKPNCFGAIRRGAAAAGAPARPARPAGVPAATMPCLPTTRRRLHKYYACLINAIPNS